MKRVLISAYYRYPNGDAGAVRQHSFAKLYKELGCEVIVAGMGEYTANSMQEYDGVPFVSFRNKKNDIVSKIRNVICYKRKLKRFLSQQNKFDIIHLVDVPMNCFLFLKKFAKKNGLKLVYDSIEWYSPEQFKKGKFDKRYKEKERLNSKLIDEKFSVIAISTFLEKHFLSRGIKTVRIPVIMDVESIPCEKKTDDAFTSFFYAGSPGKKDYLAEIIKGFSLLDKTELAKTRLTLAGINKEQLVSLCGAEEDAVNSLGGSLVCLGRIPRKEVLEQLKRSDFTVLLRSETQRYAKAGFPTKVVESLASATPVVTNLTSDLGMYLKDCENSKIVKECSPEALAEAIKITLNLTKDEKESMYQNARKTAEDFFDYKKYIDEIKTIIS